MGTRSSLWIECHVESEAAKVSSDAGERVSTVVQLTCTAEEQVMIMLSSPCTVAGVTFKVYWNSSIITSRVTYQVRERRHKVCQRWDKKGECDEMHLSCRGCVCVSVCQCVCGGGRERGDRRFLSVPEGHRQRVLRVHQEDLS